MPYEQQQGQNSRISPRRLARAKCTVFAAGPRLPFATTTPAYDQQSAPFAPCNCAKDRFAVGVLWDIPAQATDCYFTVAHLYERARLQTAYPTLRERGRRSPCIRTNNATPYHARSYSSTTVHSGTCMIRLEVQSADHGNGTHS